MTIELGYVVIKRPHPAKRRGPAGFEVEQVLDGRGYAVKWTELLTLHHQFFGFLRITPRVFEAEIDQGVEARVSPFDPGDGVFHDLDGR